MRRLATALGTLTLAGAIGLALPGTAFAAHGQLFIAPTTVIDNPVGCYNGKGTPLMVGNHTNEYALVYGGPNCTGRVLTVIAPGEGASEDFGQSVFVK
jgi:hypothetical protein